MIGAIWCCNSNMSVWVALISSVADYDYCFNKSLIVSFTSRKEFSINQKQIMAHGRLEDFIVKWLSIDCTFKGERSRNSPMGRCMNPLGPFSR